MEALDYCLVTTLLIPVQGNKGHTSGTLTWKNMCLIEMYYKQVITLARCLIKKKGNELY